MAYDQPIIGGDVTARAGSSALQTRQFYAVELTSGNEQGPLVDLVNAIGDRVFGVVQNTPGTSQGAVVRVTGISKWVSNGSVDAIVPGDYVRSDSSGKCIQATGVGNPVAGIALQGSTADGVVIAVLLTPGAGFFTTATSSS